VFCLPSLNPTTRADDDDRWLSDDQVRPQDDEEATLFRLLESATQQSATSLSARWREPSLTIHSMSGSGPTSLAAHSAGPVARRSLHVRSCSICARRSTRTARRIRSRSRSSIRLIGGWEIWRIRGSSSSSVRSTTNGARSRCACARADLSRAYRSLRRPLAALRCTSPWARALAKRICRMSISRCRIYGAVRQSSRGSYLRSRKAGSRPPWHKSRRSRIRRPSQQPSGDRSKMGNSAGSYRFCFHQAHIRRSIKHAILNCRRRRRTTTTG